ncbi:ATP-binding protein [Streptomyces sp. NPDC017095]|uniref:ATP-binding protein n=2 Tax=unclassified Streptomyces TaxID=2593676 RepID=UPI00378A1ACA
MEAVRSCDDGTRLEDTEPIEMTALLDGDGSCIAEARHLAVDFLTGLRTHGGSRVSARAVDLTQLVVSELITNARKYAPGPVRMSLRIVRDAVEVVVRDSETALPVARAADPDRVGQHGLEIVMAVAQSFTVVREPLGKSVIARIALADGRDG